MLQQLYFTLIAVLLALCLSQDYVLSRDDLTECVLKHGGVCIDTDHSCPFVNATQIKRPGVCINNKRRCCLAPRNRDRLVYRGEDCGLVERDSRIVGGVDAMDGAYPYIASIQLMGSHICGATIIHPRWALTAAHCFELMQYPSEYYSIKVGTNNLYNQSPFVQVVDVKRVISHAQFNDPSFANDVSLIEFKEPVKMSLKVGQVCLPSNEREKFENMVCTVVGFGQTETDVFSIKLQKLDKPLVPLEECQDFHCKFNESSTVYTSNMCAGFRSAGRDACQADSGGPLICKKIDKIGYERHILAGVVSYGEGCGLAGAPGIYTKVTDFLDWIEKHSGLHVHDGSYLNGTKPFVPKPIKPVREQC